MEGQITCEPSSKSSEPLCADIVWLESTLMIHDYSQLKSQIASKLFLFSPPPVKPEGTIGLHSVRHSVTLSFCLSVCHTRFPDFSWLCFHMFEWNLVTNFHMKSYRSSSTFVTVDLLFHELLPFVQNSFSGLFLAMLSHIWMKLASKLPYEEVQIKLDFLHGWPTFSWFIAICSKFVFRTFLDTAFTYLNESW